MPKPALYYAVRKALYHPVVAVTTEKPSRLHGKKWHGRYVSDNTPTHGDVSDLRGRFKTQEQAEKHVAAIREVDKIYDAKMKRLNDAMRQNYRDHRNAIEALIKIEQAS